MKIAVIGEILVEIMADTIGDGFRAPMALTGPFPSGAPAIFASQVARLGHPCGIVSSVGDDDFGLINTDRLRRDGVDVSAIRIDPDRPTGSAFVRYRPDGSRVFVFNIAHSACGRIEMTPEARALLDGSRHLHVMGTSLTSDDLVTMNLAAVERMKARGGTVSFDPNMRAETLTRPGLREAMDRIVDATDLFLPSGEELTMLGGGGTEADAVAALLARGVRAVVHKRGHLGARYHDAGGTQAVAGYPVEEVDPTGAGDCFGGAFTALWLQGAAPADALRRAAAAGALAVTVRGPMEGASDLATIDAFIAAQGGRP